MTDAHEVRRFTHALDRRRFLTRTSGGLGLAALAALSENSAPASETPRGALAGGHFAPKAKRVIYLFQSGGPSQVDLFDHKPRLNDQHGQELPKSVMGTQRVTLMTRNQTQFLCVGSPFRFAQHGQAGLWLSELLPHTARIVDDLCVIRGVHTEPINHDPAVTFMQTGRPQPGLPCMGSWLTYGLGSENADLPMFVVLLSGPADQPVPSRYYHSGFLPPKFQGVQFQRTGDPVLYLSNPPGVSRENRGKLIEKINELNALHHERTLDPEIQARIDAYEMAFRMGSSVPALTDMSREPANVLASYGPHVQKPGSYAANCLLARRLVERGVRFVQLFNSGWDHHFSINGSLRGQCEQTDQPTAALIADLKQRGLLEDTLVIWGGEFGRTSYSQGAITGNYGRDHHPACFSVWMAGGGVKPGMVYGQTDEYGYNITADKLHVNDLHATILHLLGIDHERFTYRYQGRDFRLTDVAGQVNRALLA